jgi:hypothetical protein
MIDQKVFKIMSTDICPKCAYGMRCWACDYNKTWLLVNDPFTSWEVKQKVFKETFAHSK